MTPDLSDAEWLRGGTATEGAQVELAFVDGCVVLRNSAEPAGPFLIYTLAEWEAFVAGTKSGEFDL